LDGQQIVRSSANVTGPSGAAPVPIGAAHPPVGGVALKYVAVKPESFVVSHVESMFVAP
jgi:hypothetical protein